MGKDILISTSQNHFKYFYLPFQGDGRFVV